VLANINALVKDVATSTVAMSLTISCTKLMMNSTILIIIISLIITNNGTLTSILGGTLLQTKSQSQLEFEINIWNDTI
jgi:hypothetical protein